MLGFCFFVNPVGTQEVVCQKWILSICWHHLMTHKQIYGSLFREICSEFETPTCSPIKSSKKYITVVLLRGISASGVPCRGQLFFLVHFRQVTVSASRAVHERFDPSEPYINHPNCNRVEPGTVNTPSSALYLVKFWWRNLGPWAW